MKYMLIMRSTEAALQASQEIDFEEIINQMGTYNEAMLKAGVMIGGEGLADAKEEANFIVDFDQDPPLITDGPYGETHELFNGFWLLEVPTKQHAIEWASRCPLGPGSKLEVRRVTGDEDFADFSDNEYIQKEAGWREQEEVRRNTGTAEGA